MVMPGMCSCSIGIGCAVEGVAPCSIGMVIPCIGFSTAFFGAGFLAAVFFLAVASFFAGAFCFAAGFFSGIGMVMPGMFICAIAGAETAPSASALTAANRVVFTRILR